MNETQQQIRTPTQADETAVQHRTHLIDMGGRRIRKSGP